MRRRLRDLKALVGLGGGTGVAQLSEYENCVGFGNAGFLARILRKRVFGVDGESKSVSSRSFLVCGGVSGGDRTGEQHETPDDDAGDCFGDGIHCGLLLGLTGDEKLLSLLSSPLLHELNSRTLDVLILDELAGVFSSYETLPESLRSQ